jgi:ABC-type nitrate/sulfonate/bicarbonate transport system substrate-binding protein
VKSAARIEPAIRVVAVVSADSTAHSLVIAQTEYDFIAVDPAARLPGRKLLLTPSSTAQMFVQRCLAGWNLKLDQMSVIKREQAEIRRSLVEKAASVAVVWTPFNYLAENDAAKAKSLACPDLGSFDVPALVVARADLLNETDPGRLAANRKRIATFVAKALGAWAEAKQKPVDAAKRLVKTYADETIKVTEAQARAELEARHPPDLEGQRAAFKPSAGGIAPLAATLDSIIDFMVESGTLKRPDKPTGADLLDPSILEFIANDPALSAMARGE